jgi:hypothetical protein
MNATAEQLACDCITALCGCPYVEDTSVVDHTAECLKRQQAEDRAREVAAGYVALGQFLVAHPQMDAVSGSNRRYFSVYGSDARQKIEAFIAAARDAGWELEPYESGNWAGVQTRVHGLTIAVYAPIGDLAEPPGPRKKRYRPLLAPVDEPRCPDPECGEPLALIASGAVGHCGRVCGTERTDADR